jgi:hypothetical protein
MIALVLKLCGGVLALYRTNQHAEPAMTLLSLFALVLPAALVAPKATKRKKQLAEEWEREIQLNKRLQTAGETARLEALEMECAAWRAREEAWRQTERLSPIEQTLTVQPISPATALALPRDWRVCSPSRAQAMTNRR